MATIHPVYDTDTHFNIDPVTRAISNELCEKTMLMQYDHQSERFSFDIPRTIEGHDMLNCNVVQVHYINTDTITKESSADVYVVDDMMICTDDPDKLVFTWLIKNTATRYAGSLEFNVKFSCVTEGETCYSWHSNIYSDIRIAKAIDNGEFIVEEYPDVLSEWQEEIDSIGIVAQNALSDANEAKATSNLTSAAFHAHLDDGLAHMDIRQDVEKLVGGTVISLEPGASTAINDVVSGLGVYVINNPFNTGTITSADGGYSFSPSSGLMIITDTTPTGATGQKTVWFMQDDETWTLDSDWN